MNLAINYSAFQRPRIGCYDVIKGEPECDDWKLDPTKQSMLDVRTLATIIWVKPLPRRRSGTEQNGGDFTSKRNGRITMWFCLKLQHTAAPVPLNNRRCWYPKIQFPWQHTYDFCAYEREWIQNDLQLFTAAAAHGIRSSRSARVRPPPSAAHSCSPCAWCVAARYSAKRVALRVAKRWNWDGWNWEFEKGWLGCASRVNLVYPIYNPYIYIYTMLIIKVIY